MEGVEILSVGSQVVAWQFNWLVAILCGVLFGSLIGLLSYGINYDLGEGIFTGIFVILVIGTIAGFLTQKPIKSVPTYKVVIEDTVNFNEFNEKYDVIEQDGKIYTVKEREDSNAS